MCCVACTSEQNSKVNINVVRADSLLNQVLALYEVKEYGLLLENYPPKENERATYLADETQQKTNQRVSYLWPYSGMVSGCVSLYKTTGDEKYKQLLEIVYYLGWRNIGTVNGNPIVTSLIRCNSGIVTVIMMIMTGWLSTFVIIML